MLKQLLKTLVAKLLPSSVLLLKGASGEASVYLTFDDGPTPNVTDKLFSLLEKHNAKATFFVIGKKLEQHFEIGKSLVEAGHVVGNHSYDHIDFGRLPLGKQLKQANDADAWISKLEQSGSRLFRAPQGRWSFGLLFSLVKNKFRAVHWSYDSLDYSNLSADQIVENFKQKPVVNGEILLFHDDAEKCVQVLEIMLPLWEKQGIQFKVIS